MATKKELKKKILDKGNDYRPVVEDNPCENCHYKCGYNAFYGRLSFLYFRAMFFGAAVGSIIGTLFVKFLTHLL